LGYTPEEAIGQPCYNFCHEDDVERVKAGHAALLGSSGTFSDTYRVRAKDATTFGWNRWRAAFAMEERAKCQVSSRDVTARKMAEQALRDSEERFKNAFEYSSVGMAIYRTSGHYLQVNRALCDIVGYPEAELLQTDFFSITHPADVAPGRMQLQQLLKGYVPACALRSDTAINWGMRCGCASMSRQCMMAKMHLRNYRPGRKHHRPQVARSSGAAPVGANHGATHHRHDHSRQP
jgi:PAS domain-containing protein